MLLILYCKDFICYSVLLPSMRADGICAIYHNHSVENLDRQPKLRERRKGGVKIMTGNYAYIQHSELIFDDIIVINK